MATVTANSKFQITIPKEIRESMEIEPGQKLQLICHRETIQVIPLKPIKSMKGFLKGINTSVDREA